MNNKGFTLIEVIITITLFSVIMVVVLVSVNDTFSLSSEKSLEIMYKSIISQASQYVYECDNNLIECNGDYIWVEENNIKKTSFYLDVMSKYGYFSSGDYVNPVSKSKINNCLIINVKKTYNQDIYVDLDDSNC